MAMSGGGDDMRERNWYTDRLAGKSETEKRHLRRAKLEYDRRANPCPENMMAEIFALIEKTCDCDKDGNTDNNE